MKKMFIIVLALVMAFAALPAFAQDKADWSFYAVSECGQPGRALTRTRRPLSLPAAALAPLMSRQRLPGLLTTL